MPALLTIELPPRLRAGSRFDVVVQQIAGYPRHVIGTLQLTIPVQRHADLLAPAIRQLAVIRHIAQAIPPEEDWYPIFLRYTDYLGGRVRGLGGDPDTVPPSPGDPETGRGDDRDRDRDGSRGHDRDHGRRRRRHRGGPRDDDRR